jgi:single-strand DNA-binding protein
MYDLTIIAGYVGQDPELRQLTNGTPVTNLSIAVSQRRNGQDHTTWVRVAVYGTNATNAVKFVRKGSKVLVEGTGLHVSSYMTKDGKPAATLELNANRVQFMDRPEHSSQPNGDTAEESSDIPF